jgi:DNA repair protein RecO (recombination protein O)
MLTKTAGLILHHFPYGDRSVILKIYTRELGLQSLLIPSIKSKSSPIAPSLLSPLQELDLVLYYKNKGGLERLKEAVKKGDSSQIRLDPFKACIAVYIAELVMRSATADEPHPELYDFISEVVSVLEQSPSSYTNLPIYTALNLSSFLGFYPHALPGGSILDLREGHFVNRTPVHPDFIPETTSLPLLQFLNQPWSVCSRIPLQGDQRFAILKALEQYYRIHLSEFAALKSLDVLHSVLS